MREDLYYRLNILDITIPPLRERKEDIGIIASGLLPQINERMHTHVSSLEEDVLKRMQTFAWRGNIRELRNTLEIMVLNVQYGTIKMEDVAFIFEEMERKSHSAKSAGGLREVCTLAEMEKKMIQQALQEEEGNQTKAAIRLGIDRSTLYRKISKML